MSNAITIHHLDNDTPANALAHQYTGQLRPQGVYIEMDDDGDVTVGWNGEIGTAVPMPVWHRRWLRWTFPVIPTVDAANHLLDACAGWLQRVHDGHSIRWDGSNHVGALTEDANAADDAIQHHLDTYPWDETDTVQIWDAADWLDGHDGFGITAATTDEELETIADRLVDEALCGVGDFGCVQLREAYGYLADLREAMQEKEAQV
jgi:hypothetical protein